MKTLNIFLASSYLLEPDRAIIGDLVRRLNSEYEAQGTDYRLNLDKWEDVDPFYNYHAKQGEYDDMIKNTDVFIALLKHTLGKHTRHEIKVAETNGKTILLLENQLTDDDFWDDETREFDRIYRARHPESLAEDIESLKNFVSQQKISPKPYSKYSELESLFMDIVKQNLESRSFEGKSDEKTISHDDKKKSLFVIYALPSDELKLDMARIGDAIRLFNKKHLLDSNYRLSTIQKQNDLQACDIFMTMGQITIPIHTQECLEYFIDHEVEDEETKKNKILICCKDASQEILSESMRNFQQYVSEKLSHYAFSYKSVAELKFQLLISINSSFANRHNLFIDNKLFSIREDMSLCFIIGNQSIEYISFLELPFVKKSEECQKIQDEINHVKQGLASLSPETNEEEIHILQNQLKNLYIQLNEKIKNACNLIYNLETIKSRNNKSFIQARHKMDEGKWNEAIQILINISNEYQDNSLSNSCCQKEQLKLLHNIIQSKLQESIQISHAQYRMILDAIEADITLSKCYDDYEQKVRSLEKAWNRYLEMRECSQNILEDFIDEIRRKNVNKPLSEDKFRSKAVLERNKIVTLPTSREMAERILYPSIDCYLTLAENNRQKREAYLSKVFSCYDEIIDLNIYDEIELTKDFRLPLAESYFKMAVNDQEEDKESLENGFRVCDEIMHLIQDNWLVEERNLLDEKWNVSCDLLNLLLNYSEKVSNGGKRICDKGLTYCDLILNFDEYKELNEILCMSYKEKMQYNLTALGRILDIISIDLFKAIYYYFDNDFVKCILQCSYIIEICYSYHLDNYWTQADALRWLGDALCMTAQYSKAIEPLEKCLSISGEHGLDNYGTQADALRWLGDALCMTDQESQAIEPLEKCLSISGEHGLDNYNVRADALRWLGDALCMTAQYSQAIEPLEKCLSISGEHGLDNYGTQADALRWLGDALCMTDQESQAIEPLEKCLSISGEHGLDNYWIQADALCWLGDALCMTAQYSQAIEPLEKCLSISGEHGLDNNYWTQADALRWLGYALCRTAQYSQAIEPLEKCLSISWEHGLDNYIAQADALCFLGMALYFKPKNERKKAIEMIQKSLFICKEYNIKNVKLNKNIQYMIEEFNKNKFGKIDQNRKILSQDEDLW